MNEINYIWSDKKRIMGMPISFTRYSLSEDRLFNKVGLLSTKLDELLLYRVRDISLKQSLGQKIVGVGTITIYSADSSTPALEIKNVKDPYKVKEMIYQQVEKMKESKHMSFGEFVDDGF